MIFLLFLFSAVFFLAAIGWLGGYSFVRSVDFSALYRIAMDNSLRLFRFCLFHPNMAKITALDAFQWSGLSFRTIMSIQGGIAAFALLAGVALHNPWMPVPLFLLGRIVFLLAAMFLRRRLYSRELIGLEHTLRLFLSIYMQSKNRLDSLARLEEQVNGIWKLEVGKLYRRLGCGDDPKPHYEAFAAAFPNNPHVRLLSQLLYHSEVYGGDISGILKQIIGDVMNDRLDDERNQSETNATLIVTLLLNAAVILVAIWNLCNPDLSVILTQTTWGRFLFALAAFCCFGSLQWTYNIVVS